MLINAHLQVDGFAAVCIVRGKAGLHPRVLNAFREDGPRITSCQDRDFQALLATLPQRPRTELEVAWLIEHAPLRLRLLVSGHPETKSLADLFTNLPHTRYPINTRCLGYKLRS